MDDDKLIFWTGAPGSKWSAASYVLNHTSKINIDISDQTPERCYIHSKKFGGVRHVGSYFGPGFEFGHKFHEINTLTKNNIKEEINKAFDGTHPEKFKIVRCHQFIYNLDWIRDNFPKSKIAIVWRRPEASWNGWITAGGFDITHPNYKEYYKDEQTAKTLIYEEVYLGAKWIFDNNMDVNIACNNHFKQRWGITFKSEEEHIATYIRSLEGFYRNDPDPYKKIKYDTIIAYYNF